MRGVVAAVLLAAFASGCLLEPPCDDWSYAVWQDPGVADAAWDADAKPQREYVTGLGSPDLPTHLRLSRLETEVEGTKVFLEASSTHDATYVGISVVTPDLDRARALAIVDGMFVGGAPQKLLERLEFRDVTDDFRLQGAGWYATSAVPHVLTVASFGLKPAPWTPEEGHNVGPEAGHYAWAAQNATARIEATTREFSLDGTPYGETFHVDSHGRAWYRLPRAANSDVAFAKALVLQPFPDATFAEIHVERYPMCT